ncbi:unnamed protein product [Meloidogyne enterolobii]|uniref:Uncharacterized protein n=1 Tax=Meloidogyne enterolobii TaxID=390850 RepID=A0ACB1AW44_MELEN
MNYSVLSIILLLFLLFFMLICNVFWVAFSACIFEELNFGRWWSAASIGTLIGSLFVLYFYVIIFCAFLVQINWIGRHPIDIIFA